VEDITMKEKKSFALFITIILVVLISIFSYSIVQSNIFASNLNKLKYLHLQATIELDYVKEYIQTHIQTQIENFVLNDERFTLCIVSKDENGSTIYYIAIKTKDDTPIRLSDKIIK